MKMKRFKIKVLLGLILVSCQETPTKHPVYDFFPPTSLFEEGYVSKYYYHYYPDNPDQRAATEIGYTKYTLLNDTLYRTDNYNAGFDWQSERYYAVKGDTIQLHQGRVLERGNITDTTELNIVTGTKSVWQGEMKRPFQTRYKYGDQSYLYTEYQTSVGDTIILNKPAKVFESEWNYRAVGSDSLLNSGRNKTLYVEGMGYFGASSKGSDYLQEIELIEQMSVTEFEKRADHEEYRIGYIDPSKSISGDKDFEICNHEREIVDYYWSNPDARYINGKRAMLDTIYTNVDESKLIGQNGRLVFRFVVNCEGDAGRFIAEGYDQNYQKVEYDTETVNHLFDVLQKLKKWEPVLFGDEFQDAYFYITFTIENGEIVDILP